MDVFAPAQKLSQEDFVITIGEVIPQARQQQLALSIELQIEGLREETPADVQEETLPPAQESAAAVDEEKEAVPAEESDALNLLDDCFDDLFEEEETTYTTCRLVVARRMIPMRPSLSAMRSMKDGSRAAIRIGRSSERHW